jgi:hypothetical protein
MTMRSARAFYPTAPVTLLFGADSAGKDKSEP